MRCACTDIAGRYPRRCGRPHNAGGAPHREVAHTDAVLERAGVNTRELLLDARKIWRSRIGKSLVLTVLCGLLAVQVVVFVPLLMQSRQQQVAGVIREETSRIDALLQTGPARVAADQVRHRPLLLGILIRNEAGGVAAQAGFVDFDLEDLAGPGMQVEHRDGIADVAFDVQRSDGTWRVFLRCHTRPAMNAADPHLLMLCLLGLFAALCSVALTVFVLRRKVMLPIEHQAANDPLTGLPNRTQFDLRLSEIIGNCVNEDTRAALLFIDLDRFKDFNDNFGHPQGDALLVELAQRLKAEVAADCVAARLGGDEFAVILTFVQKASDAQEQAQRILETLSQPYRYNQFRFQLSASIGVVMLPAHGADPAEAQRNADIAMYVAKRGGRAQVTMFDAAMSEAVSRRKQLEDWLRVAIDENELSVHYQPKLQMDGHTVDGAEALLRWKRPDGFQIPPGEFIPVAEESGLIVPLGRWVLTRVLTQIAAWKTQGFEAPRISVNVSANQFLDENFLRSFLEILDASTTPASKLDLEITESALMTTPDHAVSVLESLRARGVTVSLDDFGTGYSSLGYLKRFPVNAIKIDHSFVVDLVEDRDSARLVKAVIGMTHSLGLLFVAEGVENKRQLALLRDWECDLYQGHVTSPAIDADAFRTFCMARSSD